MVELKYLRIPLYGLYRIDNIEEYYGLNYEQWDNAKDEYTTDELSGIVSALTWAVDNRAYDFKAILPNLPYDNEEIYRFLTKMKASLDQYNARLDI